MHALPLIVPCGKTSAVSVSGVLALIGTFTIALRLRHPTLRVHSLSFRRVNIHFSPHTTFNNIVRTWCVNL